MIRTIRARPPLPAVCALLLVLATLPACARMPVEIGWDAQASRPDANRLVNADCAAHDDGLPTAWAWGTAIPENFVADWSDVGRTAPGSAHILTHTGRMSGYFTQPMSVTPGERVLVIAHVRLSGGVALLWLTGSPLMPDGSRGRFDERFELQSMKSFHLAPTWIDPALLRGPGPDRWVPVMRVLEIPAMETLKVGIGSYFGRGEMWVDDFYAGEPLVDLTVRITARDGRSLRSVEVVELSGEAICALSDLPGAPGQWERTFAERDPEAPVIVRGSTTDGETFAKRIFPPVSGRWQG